MKKIYGINNKKKNKNNFNKQFKKNIRLKYFTFTVTQT